MSPTSLTASRPDTPLSTLSTTAIKDGHRGRQTALRMDSYASNVSNTSQFSSASQREQGRESGGYEDDVEFSGDDDNSLSRKLTATQKNNGSDQMTDDGGIDGVSAITAKGGVINGSPPSHEEELALERTRLKLLGGLEPRAGGLGGGNETPVTEEAKHEIAAAKGVDAVVAHGGQGGMVDTSGEKISQ
ncbi:hypothetical protein BJ508DRAFT_418051 [Ascobolus immersus RN42]|uniref:Uncharacterized protein n=1 Tax=Ascobolus immersus RN42 TaxID=1160509 RepID=A0A3N4HUA7_ASCIM|nr:hypothetical protein BJ508DRAFT_418051 [Ascobolus immersus RN42]